MRWQLRWQLLFIFCLLCMSCSSDKKKLRVAATCIPHAEILEQVKPDLKAKGIDLEIVEVDDYQLPNRLLAEHQVDANFFQHLPFLQSVEKEYGNSLYALAEIHYEPLGIYSQKIKTLSDLSLGAKVAIPCDPANESRALIFLASLDLVVLKEKSLSSIAIDQIERNPLFLKFNAIDAPLLPRILPDVTIAVIPSNFALQAGLQPCYDALALETSSNYPNVLVVRKGDEARGDLQELQRALTSEKMRLFLLERYKGAIQPLF